MLQSLRQIKRRLRSVVSTQKITKAMEMVAASKLRRYQKLLEETQAYSEELARMTRTFICAQPNISHPLLEERELKEVLVLLIASDSGLCGSYNQNLFQVAQDFAAAQHSPYSFVAIGRQGTNYIKRQGWRLETSFPVPRPQEIEGTTQNVLDTLQTAFLNQTADRIFIIFTHFISFAFSRPVIQEFLPPRDLFRAEKDVEALHDIFEPSPELIADKLIPAYLASKLEQTLKEALVSEQAARRMAMKQATDNANDMIDYLTLIRNKARQATITKELIEVVTSAKATRSSS